MSNNSTGNSAGGTGGMVYLQWVLLPCGLVTILANCVVIFIAVRFIDLRNKVNQIFVISMSVADLLFGLLYMVTKPFLRHLSLHLCGPYYSLIWSCQIASACFLLYLNVDKFISIHHPLRHPAIVTEKLVLSLTMVTWTLILIYTLTVYYWRELGLLHHANITETTSCENIVRARPRYTIYTIVCYVTPLLISLGISIYIFYVAHNAGKTEISAHRRNRRRKQFITRILFVFSSTVWTALTWLPYRFLLISYVFCVINGENNRFTYGEKADACAPNGFFIATTIAEFILPLGAFGNPFITILTQRAYRARVCKVFAVCIRIPRCCLISAKDSPDDWDEDGRSSSLRLHSSSRRAASSSETQKSTVFFQVV